jgi:tRNA A-37 threonylcarbamoyl transferase component Bud32
MSLPSAMSEGEPPQADSDHALVGRVIARKFKLVRLLGAGGMGAVYEAVDSLLNRRVALKLMKPAIATNSVLVQRFVREARAADSIQHKNIVRVLDLASDEETGSFYIVQELLTGESLADKLDREGVLSARAAATIMIPVLDALAAAHERGIVHRDVKPENVFLHREADGTITPKLIDFGISKVAEGGAGLAKTQTGTALGTPYYMSPEQVRGDSSIDHRADQWSAGVMLFELVAGRRPFLGDNYNLLILEIMTRRAPRADEVTPGVDRSIATVIARALEPNRDDRFESTRAFRAALEALSLDETTGVQRVDVPREDSPTLDAERAGMDAAALDATLAADASSAVSAVGARVLETNAVAIAEAKAALPRETVAPNKRPARGALIAGLVLGALVSVAAVANLSRAGAHQGPPSVAVERGAREPHVTQPSTTVPSPIEPRAVTANNVVDAGALSNAAPLARNAPPSTRTRITRASPAQGTQGSRPVANASSATPTSPAQATTNTPRTTPAATPTSPAGGGNSPVGFRPITTYP